MDVGSLAETIKAFQDLAPSVAAVVVIGIIAVALIKMVNKVLEMFDRHAEALGVVKLSMEANTKVTSELGNNIRTNTETLSRLTGAISTLQKKS